MEYKQGYENKVVDTLSRRLDTVSANQTTNSPSTLCLISFPCPSWIDELKASYLSNLPVQSLLSSYKIGLTCQNSFICTMVWSCIKEGCIWALLVVWSIRSFNRFMTIPLVAILDFWSLTIDWNKIFIRLVWKQIWRSIIESVGCVNK